MVNIFLDNLPFLFIDFYMCIYLKDLMTYITFSFIYLFYVLILRKIRKLVNYIKLNNFFDSNLLQIEIYLIKKKNKYVILTKMKIQIK